MRIINKEEGDFDIELPSFGGDEVFDLAGVMRKAVNYGNIKVLLQEEEEEETSSFFVGIFFWGPTLLCVNFIKIEFFFCRIKIEI